MQELAIFAETYGSGGHSTFEGGKLLLAESKVTPEIKIDLRLELPSPQPLHNSFSLYYTSSAIPHGVSFPSSKHEQMRAVLQWCFSFQQAKLNT